MPFSAWIERGIVDLTYPCVPLKVLGYFVFVEPTVVSVLKTLRQIPMVEGLRLNQHVNTSSESHSTYDEGGDVVLQELVNEVRVVFDALEVDGVVSATKRDDTRPGE